MLRFCHPITRPFLDTMNSLWFIVAGYHTLVDNLTEKTDDIALLTRKERAWLLGKIVVSNATKRDLLYRIRKKIGILHNKEIPLLKQNGIWNIGMTRRSNTYDRVVTKGDAVVTNHDDAGLNWGRWSSLVKVPLRTWRKSEDTESGQAKHESKCNLIYRKWAGRDSNTRPPPCQGGILTRLDHRPMRKVN